MKFSEFCESANTPQRFDGMLVYHSTDLAGAKDIMKNGFSQKKSSGGYYGLADCSKNLPKPQ